MQADNEWDVRSIAAFGQAKIPFGDTFNLTVGGRYTDEEYELDDKIVDSNPATLQGIMNVRTFNRAGANFSTSQSFEQLTGGLILDWTLGDWLLYGSVNTGFKSGNLNANNPLSGGVDEEEIIAYELGFKSDLGGGRYRLNGSVFRYDYDNIHIQVINQNSGATVLLNGSNAELTGAELELLAAVVDGLTFNASLTVLDSEYKDNLVVPNGGGPGINTTINIAGKNVAGAPESTLTLGPNMSYRC